MKQKAYLPRQLLLALIAVSLTTILLSVTGLLG